MTDLLSRTVAAPELPADIPASPPVTLPSPAPDNPMEALEWLGGTEAEVVAGLRARGIKGRHMKHNTCPIAVYLREWFPDVMVGWWVVFYGDKTATVPPPVTDFIMNFDRHEYPDLIAE